MSDSVSIQVPARLHLGFIDMPGIAGSRFGSLGLPIQGIATELTISRSATTLVEGREQARILDYLEQLCQHLGITSHHHISVAQAIPDHAGLGSGTQLALAVSAALRSLHGLPLDIGQDAVFLGRGVRSGIGIAAFEQGGFIIDAGREQPDQVPTVVARIPFPEEWRIILVLHPHFKGIYGKQELEAFRTLPAFPTDVSATICRHTLMGIMPALAEGNFKLFGNAVSGVQKEVGNYFAPAQGGMFTSKTVEAAMHALADSGAMGIGQSSWGPTGFAFAESEKDAQRLVAEISPRFQGLSFLVVTARNHGARVTRTLPLRLSK